MTSIVSNVFSHADKIPVVGSMASGWLPSNNKKLNEKSHSFITPPPPYYEVTSTTPPSKISQLSNYVWRQGTSFLPDLTSSSAMSETTIDKKQMEHVVTLIHMASEMDQAGNSQMAKDLYIMGIDRMLSALPLETDPALKLAVEFRLSEFRNHKQLNLDQPFEETMMAIANCQEIVDDDQDSINNSGSLKSKFAHMVTAAAWYGVDVFKKSPIPDAMYYSMTCALAGLEAVDASCQLRQRTWNLAVQGVAKAMEMDRQYELHRLVVDKLVITCNALLQAAAMAHTEPSK
ncbi:hypothetical protein BCR42DRAFT_400809 [Absidia repens]|uniref:Uncharacterized protein n=1 Tax=Absidia repens TaxID=90262 RepID=A0A1X2J3B6_9FUNG|nr:hypothetical protein BCR42DRAFT_400809 [Absidia repens]